MKLFKDSILLEFQKDEWDAEKRKSRIVRPDRVSEKEEGQYQEKAPIHFFKIVAIGPDCKEVKIGDRVIPRPPDINYPSGMQPLMMWEGGEKVVKYIMLESSLAGVE